MTDKMTRYVNGQRRELPNGRSVTLYCAEDDMGWCMQFIVPKKVDGHKSGSIETTIALSNEAMKALVNLYSEHDNIVPTEWRIYITSKEIADE